MQQLLSVAPLSPPQPPQVLRTAAADIQRRDQVAFVSPDGAAAEDVAGEVTAVHRDPAGATVAVVVSNRVHFVPADYWVIIIRSPDFAG